MFEGMLYAITLLNQILMHSSLPVTFGKKLVPEVYDYRKNMLLNHLLVTFLVGSVYI